MRNKKYYNFKNKVKTTWITFCKIQDSIIRIRYQWYQCEVKLTADLPLQIAQNRQFPGNVHLVLSP